ncbi:MAG: ABC transporter ATP-binding protein, partial [archaeon]|nr:ABC transporter ATP-binding protein [archaeon]
MAEPGVIKQIGTPEEVITESNMAEVYGVRCIVEKIEGRPHVVILDSLEDPVQEDGPSSEED